MSLSTSKESPVMSAENPVNKIVESDSCIVDTKQIKTVSNPDVNSLPNGRIKHTDNGLVKGLVNVKFDQDGGNSSHQCHCNDVKCKEGSKEDFIPELDDNDVDDMDESSLCESVRKVDLKDEEKEDVVNGISYIVYESEKQMPDIMRLITKDLSEPYSIYTYRYFIHNWPKLCFLAMDGEKCVGAIVCKLDMHKKMVRRGYIAMLAVDADYRRNNIGSHLVLKAIQAMISDDCDEVVLETEITNEPALRLYERLGFVRDKRLFRYYLNGVDALRLKLWLR